MRRPDPVLASDKRLERRLVTMAFLDVVGYSRLMGLDEEATLRRWAAMRRGVIEPRLRRWRGRVVDRAGDALFAAFRNPADALSWAAEVQGAAAQAAASLQLRIAVHFGSVIEGARGALHGDDVNVAARLQAYAEPGGIIVSKAVVDAVDGELDGAFFDLGELHLRNIVRPVHAFGLRAGGVASAARPRTAATPLLGPAAAADPRPSIAVLPFRGNGAEAGDGFAADGIVEGIIGTLAGLEGLFVVSRGSTLGYAGASVDARDAGRELGVRYVLQGSLRHASGRLRIATELSDTETAVVVRADRYDGAVDDLFELQDRISLRVAAAVAPSIREHELRRATRKHPESLTAYDLVLQALDRLHLMDRESFSRAHGLLRQAIASDPDYAPAHSNLAWWHIFRIAQGWSPDPDADRAEASRAAAAAIAQDRGNAPALAVQGLAAAYAGRDFEAAMLILDRALAAGPNCALAWACAGAVCCWTGDGPNAVARAERALRLSPLDPFAFYFEHLLSQAHHTNGTFDEAVAWGRRSAAHNPWHVPTLRTLAASLVAAGRRGEACETAQRVLELEPSFRLGALAARTPLRGPGRSAFIDRLREAGMPE